MLKEERQNRILQQIQIHQKVENQFLTELLNVSLDTVRRDLTELEQAGKIVKVHGGAISPAFQIPFIQSTVYKQGEKNKIAEKSLKVLLSAETVLLGGGTIILELIKLIPKEYKGTIYTVSPLVALELAQNASTKVILIGGQVTKGAYICTGAAVMQQILQLQVELCILGSKSFSKKEGLTDTDWEVAQIKRSMIQAANETMILSLTEHLQEKCTVKICDEKEIDLLVTELSPSHATLQKWKRKNLQMI